MPAVGLARGVGVLWVCCGCAGRAFARVGAWRVAVPCRSSTLREIHTATWPAVDSHTLLVPPCSCCSPSPRRVVAQYFPSRVRLFRHVFFTWRLPCVSGGVQFKQDGTNRTETDYHPPRAVSRARVSCGPAWARGAGMGRGPHVCMTFISGRVLCVAGHRPRSSSVVGTSCVLASYIAVARVWVWCGLFFEFRRLSAPLAPARCTNSLAPASRSGSGG